MKVAVCCTQLSNGIYAEKWQKYISGTFSDVTYFSHYYNNNTCNISCATSTVSTELVDNPELHGIMCSVHLKDVHELKRLVVYDMCIVINLDYDIPEYLDMNTVNVHENDYTLYADTHHHIVWNTLNLHRTSTTFMYGKSETISLAANCYNSISHVQPVVNHTLLHTDAVTDNDQPCIMYVYLMLVMIVTEDINYA